MLLYVSLLGFIVSAILLIYSLKQFKGNIFLAAFFFLTAIWGMTFYFAFQSDNPTIGALFYGHFSPFLYLIGTSVYLYVRSVIRDNNNLYWYDLFHLIPLMIFLTGMIPYYFDDFSDKILLVKNIQEDFRNHWSSVNFLFSQKEIHLSRMILISVYLMVSLFMVYQDNNSLKINRQSLDRKMSYTLKWLLIFILITLLLSVSFGFGIFVVFDSEVSNLSDFNNMWKYISAGMYILLNINILFFPEILYGIPFEVQRTDKTTDLNHTEFNNNSEKILHTRESYGKNIEVPILFDRTYIQKIGDEIRKVEDQEFYCRVDFSLTWLSSHSGIPRHHLTWFFNEFYKVRFTDWKNSMRVQQAKKLLKNGLSDHHTLEYIGQQCGYANHSTFFTVFKKITGMTPGEFLKEEKSDYNMNSLSINNFIKYYISDI